MAIDAPQIIENQTVQEVPSLLIPIVDSMLIVPSVSVAEMVPYTAPTPTPGAPDWYMGEFIWRDRAVPLLSYEAINGGARPTQLESCRIAVFNNTGVSEELPFVGLLTQGIPRMARVNPDEISQLQDAMTKPYQAMQVSLSGETAEIPDVAALEQACLDYRRLC